MFELGQSVIDVKKDIPCEIVAIIEGVRTIYVLADWNENANVDCWLVLDDENRIIPYDKYYWDKE